MCQLIEKKIHALGKLAHCWQGYYCVFVAKATVSFAFSCYLLSDNGSPNFVPYEERLNSCCCAFVACSMK